jgi:cysteine synthase B
MSIADVRRNGGSIFVMNSALDLIGNTPMVDVSILSPNPNVRIVAKLESQNPYGSVKDRIAKAMIEDAERTGRLVPGQRIVEPSSGNTGIALAAIARMKGYPITILMPTSVSIERRQMLEVFGAEIILTPGEEGSNGAVKRAQEMAAQHPEWCFLYQYANDANPRAHYEGTGPEIFRDCPEITHFVAGLGTSGTLMGTGKYLKEQNPDIKVIAIEPPLGERVEGLRNLDDGYIPPVFDNWHGRELLDRKRVVRPRESIEWTRRIVQECGIFAGLSSGASLAGAAKVASEIEEGTIVFIVCDGGWKYLSTGAYTNDLDEAEKAAEKIIYSEPRPPRSAARDQDHQPGEHDAGRPDTPPQALLAQVPRADEGHDDHARLPQCGHVPHRCTAHREHHHPVGEGARGAGEREPQPGRPHRRHHLPAPACHQPVQRGEEPGGREDEERVDVAVVHAGAVAVHERVEGDERAHDERGARVGVVCVAGEQDDPAHGDGDAHHHERGEVVVEEQHAARGGEERA